jgi:tripartite-type tricarboxylate transporter receptor subunit TctC
MTWAMNPETNESEATFLLPKGVTSGTFVLNVMNADGTQAAKKVLTLGVFAEKRLAGAPDVPTLKEQGYEAAYVQNRGLVAPADIPADARKVYEEAFQKYMKTEIWRNYLKASRISLAIARGQRTRCVPSWSAS